MSYLQTENSSYQVWRIKPAKSIIQILSSGTKSEQHQCAYQMYCGHVTIEKSDPLRIRAVLLVFKFHPVSRVLLTSTFNLFSYSARRVIFLMALNDKRSMIPSSDTDVIAKTDLPSLCQMLLSISGMWKKHHHTV